MQYDTALWSLHHGKLYYIYLEQQHIIVTVTHDTAQCDLAIIVV